MIKYFMMIYQTVVEDEVSPGLYLFGPGISVRLESEKGWEGVLPGPFHHKADRRWGRRWGSFNLLEPNSSSYQLVSDALTDELHNKVLLWLEV